MAKLKIGMIGCGGMMGGHARAIEKMDDIEVVAVADPIEERRNEMADRFGGARTYKDQNDFYNGEKALDAVYIAVPPAEHKGIEEEAIARKWNFKVEKPMTLDPAQAKAIAAGAEKAGIVTAVGFQDRYMEITDLMKKEIDGADIALINGTWAGGVPGVMWWRKKATCGGQLLEQNIHLVDLIRYLFGEYESVYAVKTAGIVKDADYPGYDVEDSSSAIFRLKSGATATLFSACYLISGGLTIENGIIALGRQKSLAYDLRKDVRVITNNTDFCYKQTNDQIFDSNRAFFDAVIKGDPTAVRSPYGDALKSLEACFAANESMETGKVITL
jgi:predicted dehydrogenase